MKKTSQENENLKKKIESLTKAAKISPETLQMFIKQKNEEKQTIEDVLADNQQLKIKNIEFSDEITKLLKDINALNGSLGKSDSKFMQEMEKNIEFSNEIQVLKDTIKNMQIKSTEELN